MMAASLRQGSYNKKLLRLTAARARAEGVDVDVADFSEFPVPLYNFDDEEGTGIPVGAQAFAQRLGEASGVVISSPEYNHSLPGTIKNLIDWVSRIRPLPFKNKHALLLSASPSVVGGNRGLWALRVPLEAMGVLVYPSMFSLAKANQAFGDDGELLDPKSAQRLEGILGSYLRMAGALEHTHA